MSRILLSMMVTLDGRIARPDGALDWFRTGPAFEREQLALLRSVDAFVFGRVSYELLGAYWPAPGANQGFTSTTVGDEFVHLLNTVPKIVFSRTLQVASWGPARIANGPLDQEVARLRDSARDIVVFAGASLASAMMAADAIDEYRLAVHPTLLGAGPPLFRELPDELPLRLDRATPLDAGVVLMQYQRDRQRTGNSELPRCCQSGAPPRLPGRGARMTARSRRPGRPRRLLRPSRACGLRTQPET